MRTAGLPEALVDWCPRCLFRYGTQPEDRCPSCKAKLIGEGRMRHLSADVIDVPVYESQWKRKYRNYPNAQDQRT